MNPQDPKYQEKLKSIAAPEQNYFAHFAMRYPVVLVGRYLQKLQKNRTSFMDVPLPNFFFQDGVQSNVAF